MSASPIAPLCLPSQESLDGARRLSRVDRANRFTVFDRVLAFEAAAVVDTLKSAFPLS